MMDATLGGSSLVTTRDSPAYEPGGRAALGIAADWAFQFVGVLAPDGTLLDANRAALAFIQAAREEVVGRRFWDTPWWSGSPTAQERLRRAIARAARGEFVRFETEHTSPDGQRIIVDFSLTPVVGPTGAVELLVPEGRDVSARRRAEAERQRLLEEAVSSRATAEMLARRSEFLARAGDLLHSSLAYEETFGALARLIVPTLASYCVVDELAQDGTVHRLQVVHGDPARQPLADRLREYPRRQASYPSRIALETGEPELVTPVTDEFLAAHAEDAEHLAVLRALAPASLIVLPLRARGHALGALLLARDDTMPAFDDDDLSLAAELARVAAMAVDNARLYRQAQRAIRSRDDVLAVVSHDLRNPLSVIAMCTGTLLSADGVAGGAAEEGLRTAHDAAEWAQRLIQDLLDVTSIETGRLSVETRPEDPVLLVARAAIHFEALAADRGVHLVVELPEHLPSVRADADRLLQALANLMSNALKFTPVGGAVFLGAAATDGEVRFHVADTGPGIPDEQAPRVFERFWTDRRGSSVRGSGLGLAIVRGIADAHRGRAWYEARPGGGSVFRIALPRDDASRDDA
jgi:PAS domain S-box-containing protein